MGYRLLVNASGQRRFWTSTTIKIAEPHRRQDGRSLSFRQIRRPLFALTWSLMPKAKEFTITIEDKPGALGKCFLTLGERGVNVLAVQSFVEEGESLAR